MCAAGTHQLKWGCHENYPDRCSSCEKAKRKEEAREKAKREEEAREAAKREEEPQDQQNNGPGGLLGLATSVWKSYVVSPRLDSYQPI